MPITATRNNKKIGCNTEINTETTYSRNLKHRPLFKGHKRLRFKLSKEFLQNSKKDTMIDYVLKSVLPRPDHVFHELSKGK